MGMQVKVYTSIGAGACTFKYIEVTNTFLRAAGLYLESALRIPQYAEIWQTSKPKTAPPDQAAKDLHKQEMVSECLSWCYGKLRLFKNYKTINH